MAKKNTQSPDFASGNSHQHRRVLFHCLYTGLVKIISAEFLVKCISSEQHHLGHHLGTVSAIKWKGITPFMKQVRRALRRQSCGPSRDDVCVEPGARLLLLGSCRGRAIRARPSSGGSGDPPAFLRTAREAAASAGGCLGNRPAAAALPLQAPAATEASRCWPGALALTWQEWEAPIGRLSGPQSSAPLGRCSQRRIARRRDPPM